MRRDDGEKLAGRDHLRTLPERREVALIAGHEVIGARGVCALDKPVVVRVGRHLQRAGWTKRDVSGFR